jgi:DNA repair exonuclease SbcCD ATPase subunit
MVSDYTHIIHLGDIHIRNGNEIGVRLEEYQTVFKHLFENLNELVCVKNNSALITVCGDIFHNKNKLEPYAVQLWNTFIKGLTNIAPTILICGNHDYRQEAPDTPDLIQVMYDTMGDTKYGCYYLNETGTYLFENIEMGLVCIKDTLNDCSTSGLVEELPEFPTPIHKEAIPVALFHGTITQSSLPNGQTIPAGKGYPLEWFKNYDMVLLGDNHKQQIHKSTWGMSWGYPGSLIQQDIGEPVYGHGYLLWDITTKTATAHHIYNPYGRFKIRMKNDIVQVKLDISPYTSLEQSVPIPWFPKQPNLHVIGNTGDDVPILSLCKKLKLKPVTVYTILTTSKELFEEDSTIDTSEQIHEISNFNNPNTWIDYIRSKDESLANEITQYQWFHNPSALLIEPIPNTLSTELTSAITKIRSKIQDSIQCYQSAQLTHLQTNHKVVLKHMAWEWTFSYGQENWFDFEKMEGHIGILNGPNASGKSSFIDTLCIGLFGEATPNRQMNSSKKISNHYIHSQRPNSKNATNAMHVKIILDVDGERYEILRKFVMRQDKQECTALSTELYTIQVQTNEKILKASGTLLVNEWVYNHCGTIEDVMRTSIVLQLDNQNFFYAKPEEQKRMIDQAVNLSVLQSYSQIVHETLLGYNQLIKILSTILNTNLENSQEDFIASEEEIKTYENEYNEITQILQTLETEKESLLTSIGTLFNHPPKESLEYYQQLYKQWNSIEYNVDILNALIEKRSVLLHCLETNASNETNISKEDYDQLSIELIQLQEKLQLIKTKQPESTRPIDVLSKSLDELDQWFEKHTEWINHPTHYKDALVLSESCIEKYKSLYEEWIQISIEPCKINTYLLKDAPSIDKWKEHVSKYLSTKSAHDTCKQELNGLLKIYNITENTYTDYESWLDTYKDYETSVQLCDENDWVDLEKYKKNYIDTQAYILKRKSLQSEYNMLQSHIVQIESIIKNSPTWEEKYKTWQENCVKYEHVKIEEFEEAIQERTSLKESLNKLEQSILDSTKILEDYETSTWLEEYTYWREKETQSIKYKWVDKNHLLKQISLHEDALVNHRTFTKQLEQLQEDLKLYENYPFNPSCDACCKNPFHLRYKKMEEQSNTLETSLKELGEYKQLEKRLAYYKKGLECHTYVEKYRESMEEKYKDYMNQKQKHTEIITACKTYLSNIPSVETIEASLNDAIHNKELYIDFIENKNECYRQFTWMIRTQKDLVKLTKKSQILEEKLNRMQSEKELEKTLDYWKRAEETLSFVTSKKDLFMYEKTQWDTKLQQMELYKQLSQQLEELQTTLQEHHEIAYTFWIDAGEKIKQLQQDSLQEHLYNVQWNETYLKKKTEYDALMVEKQSYINYQSWETKMHILENQLSLIQSKIHRYELEDISSQIQQFETQHYTKQAIDWYTYQTTKQALMDYQSRHTMLHTLLEQYRLDTRRTESKTATTSLLQSLFKEWTKRRDLLQQLDERLVNEKGKKQSDSDTFKEWIYAQHIIPLLEKQVNRFLSNIETIRFRMAYTSKQLLYYVQDRGNETSIGASSGYQQFVIGLAIRQALTMLGGSNNSLQHMFIDEGFTACDAKNLEKTHDVLRLLIDMGHYKSILLVTHLEHVKDMIPLKINIQRNDAFSRLIYGQSYPSFTNGVKKRGRPSKNPARPPVEE